MSIFSCQAFATNREAPRMFVKHAITCQSRFVLMHKKVLFLIMPCAIWVGGGDADQSVRLALLRVHRFLRWSPAGSQDLLSAGPPRSQFGPGPLLARRWFGGGSEDGSEMVQRSGRVASRWVWGRFVGCVFLLDGENIEHHLEMAWRWLWDRCLRW